MLGDNSHAGSAACGMASEVLAQLASMCLPGRVKCNCHGRHHPLLDGDPNCLSCGRIHCEQEGYGPCLHCGAESAVVSGRRTKKKEELRQREAQAMMERLIYYDKHAAKRTTVVDDQSEFAPDASIFQYV